MTPRQSRSQGHGASVDLASAGSTGGHAARAEGAQEPRPATIAELLRRQASLLSEAAEISAQIAEIQVAASADIGVMGDVIQLCPQDPAPAAPAMTVADVARRLQVDPRTVRRWRQSGELPPAVEVSGIIRWRAEVIEEWVLAREGEPSRRIAR